MKSNEKNDKFDILLKWTMNVLKIMKTTILLSNNVDGKASYCLKASFNCFLGQVICQITWSFRNRFHSIRIQLME